MRTISRVILASVAMAALIVMAQAQDEPKSPWEIVVSGDTLEAMKVSIALHEKVDQSTPEGVAAAYCMLADDRAAVQDMEDAARERWQGLLHQAMEPHEQRILSTGMYEAHVKARGSRKLERPYSIRREATTISGIEAIDDHNAWVTCMQVQVVTHQKALDAEAQSERKEEKVRFHTRKGDDGKWRIHELQSWQFSRGAGDKGEGEYDWEKSETVLWSLIYFEHMKPTPISEPDQSTPEAAARSVLDWLLPTRERLERDGAATFLSAWSAELKALHTPEYIKACTETAKRNVAALEAWKADLGVREIESVKEDDDGTKVIKFKAMSSRSGGIEIRLKENDATWMVTAAGYYERQRPGDTNDGLKYVAVSDIYELAHR